MNISYRESASHLFGVPVTSFLYPDTCAPAAAKEAKPAEEVIPQEVIPTGPPPLTREEIQAMLAEVRANAIQETENRLRSDYEARSAIQLERIKHALELFVAERKDYFSRVEGEVVQLALAIARQILHREAQVDSMLVAALVRVAVDKLHDGSSVSVRVAPEVAGKWSVYLSNALHGSTVTVVEDAHLAVEDCVLETDLGSANFGIEVQLKEVEQGFFDLLAQRPVVK